MWEKLTRAIAELSEIPEIGKQLAANHIFEQHVQAEVIFCVPDSI